MSTPLSLTAASLTRGAKPCQAGADQRRRAGTTTLSTLRRDLRVRQDEAVSGRPALVVEQLTKRFGDRVAVNAVSFTVAAGEVFGFLGRNGGFCLSRRRISPPFAASGPPAGRPDAIGADSSCTANQRRAPSCMGCKKWLTARLPIFSPWFVPVSTASRKWKPT
jgi:hypothetical protein